jgi:hypothetical protein
MSLKDTLLYINISVTFLSFAGLIVFGITYTNDYLSYILFWISLGVCGISIILLFIHKPSKGQLLGKGTPDVTSKDSSIKVRPMLPEQPRAGAGLSTFRRPIPGIKNPKLHIPSRVTKGDDGYSSPSIGHGGKLGYSDDTITSEDDA